MNKDLITKEEARQLAIDWQSKVGRKSISYLKLIEWVNFFSFLAKKHDLTEKFKENGII